MNRAGRVITSSIIMTWLLVGVATADNQKTAKATHYVRVPTQAIGEAARTGVDITKTVDYGSFAWLMATDDAITQMQAAGIDVQIEESPFTLTLGGESFDPVQKSGGQAPTPRVAPTGADLQLVQFDAPAKAAWLQSVQADGVQIVQYIHPRTYVVWAEPEQLADSADHPHVRWAGSFEPDYRLLPRFRALADVDEDVNVLLYRGADVEGAISQMVVLDATMLGRERLNDTFEVVQLRLSAEKLADIAHVPGVYSVQPIPRDGGLRSEMSGQVNVNNITGGNLAYPGYMTWLNSVALSGAGVTIANVDGGIQHTHPDLIGRMLGCSGSTCGGSASSSHGTHTAGIMAADGSSGVTDSDGFLRGLGVAPGANLVEQVYSPWYQQAGGMRLLMKDSQANGAQLSGNSWGPAGSPLGYDNDTMQVDIGVRDANADLNGNQPFTYVLSFMNGYGSTSTQGTPDEAKNIFTIGSTKMRYSNGSPDNQINDLSSNTAHGPALDGRTIPHMVAPGCYIDSTLPTNSHGLNCGTSMASPQVTGAVALFIEYYRGLDDYVADPSPAMVKAAFLPVAHDLAGNQDADGGTLGHPFDSKQGWGRMDLEAVVDPAQNVAYFDNPQIFDNTGEEWTTVVTADNPSEPIRIMLVWTDAAGHGLGGSTPAWNNNLDLIVEAGATTYRGNNFGSTGWSVSGGSADYRNNTEGVFIGPTAPDQYTIRVRATDLNSDAIPGEGDTTDQDFALVCYNCFTGPVPPQAFSGAAATEVFKPVEIALDAHDDGRPETPGMLSYVVTALPSSGSLVDMGAGAIEAGDLPYTLAAGGNMVSYLPGPCFEGADSFDFKANDGGVAPDGGDSNVATVTIGVTSVPGTSQLQYSFPLDSDPGWTTEGDWAFGTPTGGGTHNYDPTSGYTGSNVYGYDLNDDYPRNLPERALTTTAIDCTNLSGTELRFWRWLGVERFDTARIEVSNDGSGWTELWSNPSAVNVADTTWTQQSLDISAVADDEATVYVRWIMGPTDSSVTYPGWNIDDIEIWAAPVSEADFNTDSYVNMFDYTMLETCLTGPGASLAAQCTCVDIDNDGDVDLRDFAAFGTMYGGQ